MDHQVVQRGVLESGSWEESPAPSGQGAVLLHITEAALALAALFLVGVLG